MKGFVPREKMSKKQKKELDSAKRSEWSFSPVTRRVENKKLYNRKRKSDVREEMRTPGFFVRAVMAETDVPLISKNSSGTLVDIGCFFFARHQSNRFVFLIYHEADIFRMSKQCYRASRNTDYPLIAVDR